MNGFSLTFVASFVLCAMHVLGVYLGNIFMMVLGEYWLKIISIVAFLIFGIMMIKEAITEEDEDADTKIKEVEDEMLHKDSVDKNDKESGFFRRLVNCIFYNNAVNVGVIILCAEMGDRSQISAVALSAFYEFWVVAVAGSVGHILAVVIAVLFGVIVARFVTEKCTNYIGGILFLIFSAYSLFNLYQLENGAVSV